MKKILPMVAVALLLLTSCAESRLYYWGDSAMSSSKTSMYEQLAYRNYDKQSAESTCALVCLYADMVSHPGGTRKVVPPGIYAEYGYLLLLPTTAEAFTNSATKRQRKMFGYSDYSTGFYELGIKMLEKEVETYPESAKFIEPLLKRAKGGKDEK